MHIFWFATKKKLNFNRLGIKNRARKHNSGHLAIKFLFVCFTFQTSRQNTIIWKLNGLSILFYRGHWIICWGIFIKPANCQGELPFAEHHFNGFTIEKVEMLLSESSFTSFRLFTHSISHSFASWNGENEWHE